MKTALKNLLLMAVSTLFALILGIGIIDGFYLLRHRHGHDTSWHDPNTGFDPELGWAPLPGRRLRYPGGTITSNTLGFRSPEPDPSKKQSLILGDSVAWGFGVSDEYTLTHLLNERLAPSGRQVSCLAVSGYGTDQEDLFLHREMVHFPHPEYVILILYAGNDFQDTGSNAAYGKRKPLFRAPASGGLTLTGVPIWKYCLRNALSLSLVAGSLSRLIPPVGSALGFLAGDRTLNEAETTRVIARLLEEMNREVTARGGRFAVVIAPTRDDFKTPSENLLRFEKLLQGAPFPVLNYYRYILSKNVQAERVIYLDDAHYTPAGNSLLAQTLQETFWPQLTPSPAAPSAS